MVIDLATYEVGLFGYGAMTIIGTDLFSISGDLFAYGGWGWKGIDREKTILDKDGQWSGYCLTADFGVGAGVLVAKASVGVAVAVAAKQVSSTSHPLVNTLQPQWDKGKTLSIGAGVGVGPSLPIDVDVNIGIQNNFFLFGVKVTDCGRQAPYCLAALLFMTPPICPIFQKILVINISGKTVEK